MNNYTITRLKTVSAFDDQNHLDSALELVILTA